MSKVEDGKKRVLAWLADLGSRFGFRVLDEGDQGELWVVTIAIPESVPAVPKALQLEARFAIEHAYLGSDEGDEIARVRFEAAFRDVIDEATRSIRKRNRKLEEEWLRKKPALRRKG